MKKEDKINLYQVEKDYWEIYFNDTDTIGASNTDSLVASKAYTSVSAGRV